MHDPPAHLRIRGRSRFARDHRLAVESSDRCCTSPPCALSATASAIAQETTVRERLQLPVAQLAPSRRRAAAGGRGAAAPEPLRARGCSSPRICICSWLRFSTRDFWGELPAVLRSGCWVLGSGSRFRVRGFRVRGSGSALGFGVPRCSSDQFPVPALGPESLVLESPDRGGRWWNRGDRLDPARQSRSPPPSRQPSRARASGTGAPASRRGGRCGAEPCAPSPRAPPCSASSSTRAARPQPRPVALSPPSAQAASVSASRQPSTLAGDRRSACPASCPVRVRRPLVLSSYRTIQIAVPCAMYVNISSRFVAPTSSVAHSKHRAICASFSPRERRSCSTASRIPCRVRASCRDVVASCSFSNVPVWASVSCCA